MDLQLKGVINFAAEMLLMLLPVKYNVNVLLCRQSEQLNISLPTGSLA